MRLRPTKCLSSLACHEVWVPRILICYSASHPCIKRRKDSTNFSPIYVISVECLDSELGP